MFIVFKLRYGNFQNSFKIYCQKSSTKKDPPTCIALNVCFIFNPSSILTPAIILLYVPINDLARTILKSSNSIPSGYNTL